MNGFGLRITTSAAAAALMLASAAQAGHHGAPAAPGASPFEGVPNARPGECFARVLTPAQYEMISETVVVEDAAERLRVSDAQFAPRHQDVLVKEGAVRYQVTEPVYQTVAEQVLVRPAYERLVVEPAQYQTVTEAVEVQPARLVWKAGHALPGSHGSKIGADGAVYCLVEEPAQVQHVSRRVLVKPETTRAVTVRAEYATVHKQVVVEPAQVLEQHIEPAYKTMTVHDLAAAPGVEAYVTPAKTATVQKRVLVAEERYEWVRVLCETNATPEAVRRLQSALQARGYYAGPIDGAYGPATAEAMTRFQRDAGLPHAGYLTLETLDALEHGWSSSAAPAPAYGAPAYADSSSALLGGPASADAGSVRYVAEPAREPSHAVAYYPGDVATSAPVQAPSTRRLYWKGKR